MRKKYQVLSPDGLPITPEPIEGVVNTARAMAFFALRYVRQGYYKTADGDRIDPQDLPLHCTVEEVT